jgi:hypothetical protein
VISTKVHFNFLLLHSAVNVWYSYLVLTSMRFKIFTVVSIKVAVSWDVTTYTLVKT